MVQPPLPEHRTGPVTSPRGLVVALETCSNAADSWTLYLFPLLMLTLTKDPFWVGMPLAVMQGLSLLGVAAGSVSDGRDPFRLSLGVHLGKAGVVAALAVVMAAQVLQGWMVVGAAALLAVLDLFANISGARIMVEVVDEADLGTVNSRAQVAQTVAQTAVVRPFSSMVFAVQQVVGVGIPTLFHLSAAAVAARLARHRRGVPPAADPPERGVGSVRRSLRSLFGQGRRLAVLNALTVLAVALLQFAEGSAMFYLVEVLGVPVAWVGVVLVSASLLGALGAFLAGPVTRRTRWLFAALAVILLGTGGSTIGMALVAADPLAPVVVAALMAVGGFFGSAWNVVVATLRLTWTDKGSIGAAIGGLTTILGVVLPLATLLSGYVARTDPRLTWLVGGVALTLLAVVPGWLHALDRRHRREPVDAGEQGPS